jgi:hypothetical protein
MSPARRIVRYSSSCAASSSILLIALIRRILFDVSVTPLLIEVFTTWNLLLSLKLRVGSGTFVAPLVRGHGRHFGHYRSPLNSRLASKAGPFGLATTLSRGPSRDEQTRSKISQTCAARPVSTVNPSANSCSAAAGSEVIGAQTRGASHQRASPNS